jgi:hypothetical protein
MKRQVMVPHIQGPELPHVSCSRKVGHGPILLSTITHYDDSDESKDEQKQAHKTI